MINKLFLQETIYLIAKESNIIDQDMKNIKNFIREANSIELLEFLLELDAEKLSGYKKRIVKAVTKIESERTALNNQLKNIQNPNEKSLINKKIQMLNTRQRALVNGLQNMQDMAQGKPKRHQNTKSLERHSNKDSWSNFDWNAWNKNWDDAFAKSKKQWETNEEENQKKYDQTQQRKATNDRENPEKSKKFGKSFAKGAAVGAVGLGLGYGGYKLYKYLHNKKYKSCLKYKGKERENCIKVHKESEQFDYYLYKIQLLENLK